MNNKIIMKKNCEWRRATDDGLLGAENSIPVPSPVSVRSIEPVWLCIRIYLHDTRWYAGTHVLLTYSISSYPFSLCTSIMAYNSRNCVKFSHSLGTRCSLLDSSSASPSASPSPSSAHPIHSSSTQATVPASANNDVIEKSIYNIFSLYIGGTFTVR